VEGMRSRGVEIYPVQKQKSLGPGVSVSKLLVQKGQSKWKGSRYKFEPWTGIIESKKISVSASPKGPVDATALHRDEKQKSC
jgi:hypothetical protein